ncbi:inositol 2-dehydrogenase [Acidiphilium sp. AL]|uniref:Inositol 2-dehydrogenase n=1 Tax=Acidiphilium iwatense TaxID=768198 RepID=A0ABS9DZK9_9PROT|nr:MULTISPECIES: inositol 2-dehydrogenase [Acidiphilium]MCF3948129.1 inositol 2-dehydrogenase [Acidiphilium iwatense]MCU4161516.1 inositol 2-dehydrogenase [Acidiphilium sp. AL]
MTQLNIALIGAGRIGRVHAASIAAHPDCRLATVSDAIEDAARSLAAETGAAVTPAEAAIGDPATDAVMICAPTDVHAALIETAARAGKPVFCEKPVDLDAARIRACLAVVRSTGIPLMIGFNRRFDPSFRDLKRRLDAGRIGSIELVSILSKDPAPPPVSYIERSGGLFRDMMIHDLDMARFLLGEELIAVHAAGSALVDPAIGAAGDVDTAVVTLRTGSGKLVSITNSRRATYGYDQRIEVHGSGGMLAAGNRTQTTVTEAGASGYITDPALPFFLERYADAYRAELDAFVAAIKGGTMPEPDGEDGLAAQILADAATESAKTGQTVHLQ